MTTVIVVEDDPAFLARGDGRYTHWIYWFPQCEAARLTVTIDGKSSKIKLAGKATRPAKGRPK